MHPAQVLRAVEVV
jgi:DNA-binding NarL/FixJ family response regulator